MARAVMRKGPRQFVGIDGEGVTDEVTGEHAYVLLSCGDKHLAADGAHLEFAEIMGFLWSCFEEQPRAVFVGFFLKYDFAQWLRTLPEGRGKALLKPQGDKDGKGSRIRHMPHAPPFPVTHQGWDFDYLYGRRFKLRPHRDRLDQQLPWMFINDAGSYFQTSFLKAINPAGNPNPVCSQDEYDIIDKGKDRRNRAIYDPAMVEYNQMECLILQRLMQQLEEGVRANGLKLKRDQWFGPGQIAQQWLKKIGMPRGQYINDCVPVEVREAARASYYGGWFEIFWHGLFKGNCYGYDLNSAYPFVCSQLPCLLHGNWQREVEREGGKLLTWAEKDRRLTGTTLVRARVEGRHAICGAMQHRKQNRQIFRPRLTEGWFWADELSAALAAGMVERVRLFELWRFEAGCDCPPPLAAMTGLYEERLRLGKDSPAGKCLKLICNSTAGKFQQSVGQPAYANPVYASLITSGCRTLITRAIATHPGGAADLLMVATDGVVFKTRHPGLELNRTQLGKWSETRHENLSLYMPGVYWDDHARERIKKGESAVFKSRGIAAKDLSKRIAQLDKAWPQFERKGWPRTVLPVSFQLVSPVQALERGKWDWAGKVITHDIEASWGIDRKGQRREPQRILSADPRAKRNATGPGASRPYDRDREVVSLPYDGRFGDELRAMQDDELGDHPDGPVAL